MHSSFVTTLAASTSVLRPFSEGVDLESAQRDSFYWALYCSGSTMEAVRATEERFRRCLLRQHQHEERQQSANTGCQTGNSGQPHYNPELMQRDAHLPTLSRFL